jgi:hypothetical protein
MADSATWAINLDADSAAASGAELASTLENLGSAVVEDVQRIRSMNQALRNMQQGAVVDVGAFKQLQATLQETKARLAQNQLAYVKLGGTFDRVKPKNADATRGLADLSQASSVLPGRLGAVAGRMGSLASAGGPLVGTVAALAAVSLAVHAAMLAVAGAVAKASVSLARYAIASADARRTELLRLEGFSKARRWWRRQASSGRELQGVLDGLAESSALSRGELEKQAMSLHNMHLRGKNLQDALEGLSIALSADPSGREAAMFKSLAMYAGLAGGSIRKLTEDVRARLGGIAEARLLSLDVQVRKLHENLARLFMGVNIEGALKSLKSVLDIFSQQHVVGQALKTLLTDLFASVSKGAGPAALIVKRFFQGFVLMALKAELYAIRFQKALGRAGLGDFISQLKLGEVAFRAGGFALFALASAATAIGLALAGAAISIGLVGNLLTKLKAVVTELGTPAPWVKVGTSIVLGLVQGLLDPTGLVKGAATKLGQTILTGLRSAIESKSPSRAAFRIAWTVPQGIELAASRAQGKVNRAFAKLTLPEPRVAAKITTSTLGQIRASAPASAPTADRHAPSGGKVIHAHFGPGSVMLNGEPAPSELQESVRLGVERALELALSQVGGYDNAG